jgi:ABC-type bacteriocin/lantibiotic exporter with double-glycine peptidase domain
MRPASVRGIIKGITDRYIIFICGVLMTTNGRSLERSASTVARWGVNLGVTEDLDDWSSAWEEVKNSGGIWGGRSRGGRGIRKTSGYSESISVEGVTLQFLGKALLSSTKLSLIRGHRYGLVGQNGVGKVGETERDKLLLMTDLLISFLV